MILAVIIAFLAGVFIIGLVASRHVKDESDFYLGGKSFGPWATAFKFASTWESGSKLVGSPAQAFGSGMTAFLQGLTSPLAYFMSFRVFGPRLKTACDHYDTITTPEMLGKRYKSGTVQTVCAIALFVGLMGTMLGQYTSIGRVVSAVLGIGYKPALIISVVVVGAYTVFGGYRASVWTDMVQGACMVIGAVFIFIFTIHAAGDWSLSSMNANLMEMAPNMLHITGGSTMTLLTLATFLIIPLFMGIALPQQSVAIFSMKDKRVGSASLVICTLFSTFLIWGLYLAAMTAKAYSLISVENADMLMPTLAITFLPKVLAGLFIAAILAAIMSTIDGVVLVASSILTRDLMVRLTPKAYEKNPVMWSRIATAIVIIIPLVLALDPPAAVFWIVSFAMALTVFTFALPMLGVVWIKRATKEAVIVQVIVTTILIPAWVILGNLGVNLGGISSLAIGLLVAPPVFFVVMLLTKPKDDPDTEALWEKYRNLKKEKTSK